MLMLPQSHKADGNAAFVYQVDQEVKAYGKNAVVQEKYRICWLEVLTKKHKLSLAMFNAIRKLLGVQCPPPISSVSLLTPAPGQTQRQRDCRGPSTQVHKGQGVSDARARGRRCALGTSLWGYRLRV